uniref:RE45760p n=1 Tax=Drosophila melanogaster TaxID=7227 RepID=Q8MRG4_DROME|nr:RE45760p [Drosophila melanogaster]
MGAPRLSPMVANWTPVLILLSSVGSSWAVTWVASK